ncbi:thioredoxin-disulfide reductase [Dethiobacter alkaliphilus]|uniref:thioredoxin-disulfide reductase n=1 Tax=Dethiobacter alkaliphilus TaxID=427926 RepID=UPI0022277B9A|nr:thioredoxin-disulfide reductase [Dethiobacter alkaliphilus]MCW3491700.1 thioredoxin-disulfide reductase [Dethiobacter alkaliphilus]
MTKQNKVYDLIVLGAGPAGLTGAIYAARSQMSVLVIEQILSGGQISTTERVENYPGFPQGIEGIELGQLLEQQARRFGTEMALANVEKVHLEQDVKEVITTEGSFYAKTILIATGASPRPLGVPGEEEFRGRGVSYCATCDAAFFTDKEVVVVGGGDSALEEALVLSKVVAKVYLVHRREDFRAISVLQDRVRNNPKIELILNTVVEKINGNQFVESLTLRNTKENNIWDLSAEGIFLYVGLKPNTDCLGNSLISNKHGYLVTDESMETTIPGVFAAGDIREKVLRQVVTAVADGAIAAVSAAKYLDEKAQQPHEKKAG